MGNLEVAHNLKHMSVSEVSDQIGIRHETLRSWIKKDTLKYSKDEKGNYFLPLEEIQTAVDIKKLLSRKPRPTMDEVKSEINRRKGIREEKQLTKRTSQKNEASELKEVLEMMANAYKKQEERMQQLELTVKNLTEKLDKQTLLEQQKTEEQKRTNELTERTLKDVTELKSMLKARQEKQAKKGFFSRLFTS